MPEAFARRWTDRLRRNPQLTLRDVGELARSLRDAQLTDLDGVLRERGVWLGQVYGQQVADGLPQTVPFGRRHMLRAFGSLKRSDQSALLGGRAFRAADLPASARFWLRMAVNERVRADEKTQLPNLTPDTVLSLESQALERRVQPQRSGAGVVYALPGGTEYPGVNGQGQNWTVDATDFVPQAPGLAAPQGGPATGAIFRLRWPDGTTAAWEVIPPCAYRRDPPASSTSGAAVIAALALSLCR